MVGLLLSFSVPRLNNPFGVVVRIRTSFDTTGALRRMRLARRLVGEWGYVRIGADTESLNVRGNERAILIFQGASAHSHRDWWGPPPHLTEGAFPKPDPDGSFKTAASHLARWLGRVVKETSSGNRRFAQDGYLRWPRSSSPWTPRSKS